MTTRFLIFICLLFKAMPSFTIELMKDYLHYDDLKKESPLPNALVSGDIQVSSEVSDYENIVPNKPILVSIFVTHDKKDNIDVNSFRLGDQPIEVKFISSSQMSSLSPLAVSIYKWTLPGLPLGTHKLPSINVQINGKVYNALPLVIEVFNK